MVHRPVDATALLAVLSACAYLAPDTAAPPHAPMRSVECTYQGTSTVTGSGPDGSFDTSHVYALAVDRGCEDLLELIVTTDDPLAYPYLDNTVLIFARLPDGSIFGTADWSGTFTAWASPWTGTMMGHGTLQVDMATPAYLGPNPGRVRATAVFNDGNWQFTATIDAPYCKVADCVD
jgi:hypothetical protein